MPKATISPSGRIYGRRARGSLNGLRPCCLPYVGRLAPDETLLGEPVRSGLSFLELCAWLTTFFLLNTGAEIGEPADRLSHQTAHEICFASQT